MQTRYARFVFLVVLQFQCLKIVFLVLMCYYKTVFIIKTHYRYQVLICSPDFEILISGARIKQVEKDS